MKRWLIPASIGQKQIAQLSKGESRSTVLWKMATVLGLVSTFALLLLSPALPFVKVEPQLIQAKQQLPLPLIPHLPTEAPPLERTLLRTVTLQPTPAPVGPNVVLSLTKLSTRVAPPVGVPHDDTDDHTAWQTAPTPISSSSVELVLAMLINRQRQHYGIAPLTIIPALNLAAGRHSRDMSTQSIPWHNGSDGSSGGKRMQAAGYRWEGWAEVIGWGFADPASMVEWWLNHAEHRTILLSTAFTEFGIGYVSTSNTPWQDYWTVNFGRPLSTADEQVQTVAPTPEEANGTEPLPTEPSTTCPASSQRSYTLIPLENVDRSHPAALHADLNLQQRGYIQVAASPQLVDISGPIDADAPQLMTLFADSQPVQLTALYQVYDWNWLCGEHGCRGALIHTPDATLVGLSTHPGALLRAPTRRASIYGDSYVTAVLYAEATRLTLTYTRAGSVADGYTVHIEQVCVDPNLVQLYQEADRMGRQQLPGLQHDQIFGIAIGTEVRIAIRDRGTFLDPRSRKDWWQGF